MQLVEFTLTSGGKIAVNPSQVAAVEVLGDCSRIVMEGGVKYDVTTPFEDAIDEINGAL